MIRSRARGHSQVPRHAVVPSSSLQFSSIKKSNQTPKPHLPLHSSHFRRERRAQSPNTPKARDVAQAPDRRRRAGAGGRGRAVPEETPPADGARHDVAVSISLVPHRVLHPLLPPPPHLVPRNSLRWIVLIRALLWPQGEEAGERGHRRADGTADSAGALPFPGISISLSLSFLPGCAFCFAMSGKFGCCDLLCASDASRDGQIVSASHGACRASWHNREAASPVRTAEAACRAAWCFSEVCCCLREHMFASTDVRCPI